MRAFLSHSSSDKPLATKIYRALRDQAVSVWFDRLEMRPGDSLLKKIADGIRESDYLLVLVTENSKQSAWVEKEITIALTQEIQNTGPKVIPLLLEGCGIPVMLADKYYVTISEGGKGMEDIIPAIFRDSYIVDIILNSTDLECDFRSLQEELYEYIRSSLSSLRIRINNENFSEKINDIIDRVLRIPDLDRPLSNQIKRVSEAFQIELPIFWANLADLLSQLITKTFGQYGKTLEGVKVALTGCKGFLRLADHTLARHLQSAVFPIHARQFGYPEIAAFMERFEKSDSLSEEDFVRQKCEIDHNCKIAYVELGGKESRRISDTKIYLPIISTNDHLILQMTCHPETFIDNTIWYFWCLPQILDRFLITTVFREGKPLHEIDYPAGLSIDDYYILGLA